MARRFPDDVPVLTDGTVRLRAHCPQDTAEVGYGLHPKARGRGFTARALNLVLGYAFGEDGIEVMHWRAVVGNWPSRKVAWRCGFRVEGTVRGFCPHPGGAQDAWIGSLHRDDPRRPCEPWPSGG